MLRFLKGHFIYIYIFYLHFLPCFPIPQNCNNNNNIKYYVCKSAQCNSVCYLSSGEDNQFIMSVSKYMCTNVTVSTVLKLLRCIGNISAVLDRSIGLYCPYKSSKNQSRHPQQHRHNYSINEHSHAEQLQLCSQLVAVYYQSYLLKEGMSNKRIL